ncbi:MAG: KUP/HAK/KT family potassium transporter [Opitutaceae bacterium]
MSSPSTTPLKAGAKAALVIGALGVVFGDIGTSPLYTVKECIAHLPPGVDITAGVLGALSLLFWALALIVCVKYLGFITKADNQGEGGIFALLALLHTGKQSPYTARVGGLVVMILIGAALLYGDGIITPAISVLGAAEGFIAINPRLEVLVVPAACVILAVLFWFQHKGTMRIGSIFGPVMLIWFATLAALGTWQIVRHPGVLAAVNPLHGIALLQHADFKVVAGMLGAVVLVFTGTEALYADMGHFGRKHIALAWYGAAFPGLLLNYFGQGAFILSHPETVANYLSNPTFLAAHPEAVQNPFYALAPAGLPRALLTALSFLAAVIASQALISGCYSLTRQAIQLGYFPRLRVSHTHADFFGQIYMPFVNTLLAIGSILTVILFKSTNNISAAYGIAVTGTMAITTIAYFLVARNQWRRPLWIAVPICGLFLVVDLAFFGSNMHKFTDGGWFPLAIGAGILAVMLTWKKGRAEIYQRVYGSNVTEEELKSIARSKHITRVGGAAVFMVGSAQGTPIALLHHVKSNRTLHKTVVLLSITTEEVPTVTEADQLTLTEIGEGIWRAVGHYGYMQSPDAGALMERVKERGVPINPSSATYFFNREMIITGGNAKMWEWQKSLYSFLSRNARPAKDYFQIPPSQIIEIGLPLQL